MQLTVGSLFAAIGGLELGLERTGHFKTIWQVESDEYCRRVLEKHWPEAQRFGDIRTFKGYLADTKDNGCNSRTWMCENRERTIPAISSPESRETCRTSESIGCGVDVVCGGFPCQDISNAGKRAGIQGSRSGLWTEMARVVSEVRPRYVLVENVSALLGRGIDTVLWNLGALGYHAEWDCVPALALGAPHRRDRIFIVAYRESPECEQSKSSWSGGHGPSDLCDMADSRRKERDRLPNFRREEMAASGNGGKIPDAVFCGLEAAIQQLKRRNMGSGGCWEKDPAEQDPSVQSFVGRVAHGVPNRVDRLRCLGNAVVPQVAEAIGKCIVEFDRARREAQQREGERVA